jgi:predicted AlkP superfamily pyrophosphatase or phosphodiesterase
MSGPRVYVTCAGPPATSPVAGPEMVIHPSCLRAFMRLPSRPALFLANALVLAAAASCDNSPVDSPLTRSHPPVRAAATSHVIIVSIDGLRPDAITPFRMPTVSRLASEGSATFEARTIYPSRTLPSHTSMLTGVTPAEHGIDWNEDKSGSKGVVKVPTVFGLAHERGMTTAAFFSKTKFHHLEVPGTIDFDRSPATDSGNWQASRTIGQVESYLASHQPNLLFVHIGEPDYAGHESGWMSEPYLRATSAADSAVSRILAAARSAFGLRDFAIIVTADHGGHDKGHGSLSRYDMTIPWIAWGAGVPARTSLGTSIRTMDTAATALWLLGVGIPTAWSGTAVLGE